MKPEVKIIKLINGDDIVTVLPTVDKQLPDNGPLIRLTITDKIYTSNHTYGI